MNEAQTRLDKINPGTQRVCPAVSRQLSRLTGVSFGVIQKLAK